MTEQNKSHGNTPSGVLAKNPKGAGRKKLLTGLYQDLTNLTIPYHSPVGRLKRKIIEHLSGPFLESPSPFAQALMDGLAANMIMAKYFQAAFLRGNKIPASILRDYTGLWNSISRDLDTLSRMAKERGAKDPIPSLSEYLDGLKSGKLQAVEPVKDDKPEPVTNEKDKVISVGKKTLF